MPRKRNNPTRQNNRGNPSYGGRNARGAPRAPGAGGGNRGNGGTFITLNPAEGFDRITDTQKVTAGYFTGGSGQINAPNLNTMSLADSNEAFYFNIAQTHPLSASAAVQFSVAYGHVGGSGSKTNSNNVEGATEAIYRQWGATLLGENEVSGGFVISSPGSTSAVASGRDNDIYVLVGKRANFKDRINKKNWTIALSGSNSVGSGSGLLYLTDDSATTTATATVAGPRFNIVAGSDGAVTTAATTTTYGWLYPDAGVMVFSAAELSSSIGGKTAVAGAVIYESGSHEGFVTNGANDTDEKNALRFANCLKPSGAYLKFRSEEDQTSVSYFCRAKARDLNFSNNPTFVSGSYNEIRHRTMWGNPTTYISGIGLYNNTGQMVAIGKLSTPLKKNFSSEVTIKVKLTY